MRVCYQQDLPRLVLKEIGNSSSSVIFWTCIDAFFGPKSQSSLRLSWNEKPENKGKQQLEQRELFDISKILRKPLK